MAGRSLHLVSLLGIAASLVALPLAAQDVGTASGRGSIVSMPSSPTVKEQRVDFSPRYAFAYVEGRGAGRYTWIVLTEKEPPLKAWAGSKDRAAARQQWCEKEKAGFVAVKIDAQNDVDLYFLCPPGGAASNTEMVSTINGLKSVVVQYTQSGKRLTGTLRGGEGWCSVNDKSGYCTTTSDYRFDAPLLP